MDLNRSVLHFTFLGIFEDVTCKSNVFPSGLHLLVIFVVLIVLCVFVLYCKCNLLVRNRPL